MRCQLFVYDIVNDGPSTVHLSRKDFDEHRFGLSSGELDELLENHSGKQRIDPRHPGCKDVSCVIVYFFEGKLHDF